MAAAADKRFIYNLFTPCHFTLINNVFLTPCCADAMYFCTLMKTDIVAFGVHPDDLELGCGGTLIAAIAEGKKVAVIDLTRGELGTRGSAEIRSAEAAAAAEILGVHARENLAMADGFFQHNEENIRKIITAIRKYQPQVVICSAPEDRHPDHGRSSKLISDAAFLSGLRRIETTDNNEVQQHWRPAQVFHYIQDRYLKPDFVYDISPYFEQKLKAVLCYTTQFNTLDSSEPATYISNPDFVEVIRARALMFGKRIGVNFAEGYLTQKTIGITSFDHIINNVT